MDWLTASEIEEQTGINHRLSYVWFKYLEARMLAKKVTRGTKGVESFSDTAQEFLFSRIGKRGHPGYVLELTEGDSYYRPITRAETLDRWLDEHR